MPLLYTCQMTREDLLSGVDATGEQNTISNQLSELMEFQERRLICNPEERELLKKYISIYNVFLIGDLHGNFLKLLGALVQCEFITMTAEGVSQFQYLYDRMDPLRHTHIPSALYKSHSNDADDIKNAIKLILNNSCTVNLIQKNTRTLIFCGDTLFDRGHSDFFTLCIFDWMCEIGINYKIVFGNHELRIFAHNAFCYPLSSCAPGTIFQSFDYWRHRRIPKWREVFLQMFRRAWLEKAHLYLRYREHTRDCIFLTHAPVSQETYRAMFQQIKPALQAIFNTPINSDAELQIVLRRFFMSLIDNKNLDVASFGSNLTNYIGAVNVVFKHLIEFCENRLSSMRTEPWFHTFHDGDQLRTRLESTIFFSESFSTGVMIRLSDCNIFGHEGDAIPVSMHQICIDSELGKPDEESGIFRCALLAATK